MKTAGRVLALLALATAVTAAQPDPASMRMYVLGLVHRGPAWSAEADTARHMMAMRMIDAGMVAGAGPVFDDPALLGIVIFSSESVAVIQRAVELDPAVAGGILGMELHPWYAAKGIGDGLAAAMGQDEDSIPPLVDYQFGLIRRGPAWTPGETPELEKLQEAHLANIRRLAEEGTMAIAGPLTDDGVLRGVFVFQAGTIDEAKRLSETDPAVQAGRLVVDLFAWKVPAGVFPRRDGH
jgi:uncharacterized protein YciI